MVMTGCFESFFWELLLLLLVFFLVFLLIGWLLQDATVVMNQRTGKSKAQSVRGDERRQGHQNGLPPQASSL